MGRVLEALHEKYLKLHVMMNFCHALLLLHELMEYTEDLVVSMSIKYPPVGWKGGLKEYSWNLTFIQ